MFNAGQFSAEYLLDMTGGADCQGGDGTSSDFFNVWLGPPAEEAWRHVLFQGTVAAGQWIKKVVDGVLHDGDKNSRLDEVMYQVSFGEVAGDAAFSTLHRTLARSSSTIFC